MEYTEAAISIGEVFDIRSANEWIREAKLLPLPKALFGDFWLEGEVAIMFADTGKGKSALGMQIAESIAKSRPIRPFSMTAKRQKVLYLDFELTRKQFEMRYSADHDAEKDEYLKKHYCFSEKFKRIELLPETFQKRDGRPFEEGLRDLIQPLVQETGARILIVDNITYLKRTAESTRESVPLMKELQRLKKRFGLSILVIAHTPKRDIRRPLVINDMQGSKVIANYADNIFAIGQSTRAGDERYLKHVKVRSRELVYGAAHVPVFRLKKIGGNFLGFEFQHFAPESELLRGSIDEREWETIEQIKRMSDSGMTIRAIAAELEMSKSVVHRKLQMWKPSEESGVASRESGAGSSGCPPGLRRGADASSAGWSADGVVLTPVSSPLPYTERTTPAFGHPSFSTEGSFGEEEYRGQLTDQYLVSIGMRPAWKEKGEAEQREKNGLHNENDPIDNDEEVNGEMESTDDISCSEQFSTINSQLSVRTDGYGREIFVESEDPNGKPMVWYQDDSKGVRFRFERKGWAVISERVAGDVVLLE